MCEPGSSAVEVLASGIDALLGLGPVALADAELHDTVVSLQAERSRLAAAETALVGAWDTRRIWADDGSKSAAARLAREAGGAEATARVCLKRARKLVMMPATRAAFDAAKLSADQVDLLAWINQPSVSVLFARDE